MSFEINTNMNSISNFNKIFQQNLDFANQNINVADGFGEIFDNINNSASLKGSAEYIEASQKVENLSPSAKMVQDMGNGFKNGLNALNTQQRAAENALETFATGGDISIHEVMIASQKSSLSMQMALQLRNQMVNAYTQFRDIRL